MTMLHYLAYGSNLHPHRLKVRIPSSRLLGVVELPGYRLTFHKRGACGSGKCNLLPVGDINETAFAAIFEMKAMEKPILDEFEGEGYRTETMTVHLDGQELSVFAYIAEHTHIDDALQPFHWYKDIVFHGAIYHGLPAPYLDTISAVASVTDPDVDRAYKHEQLLRHIHRYS